MQPPFTYNTPEQLNIMYSNSLTHCQSATFLLPNLYEVTSRNFIFHPYKGLFTLNNKIYPVTDIQTNSMLY